MSYWLDLFTGTTWDEFRSAGANVSGFRSTRQKMVERIKPGDILICYLTGVMRWVGALEVIGKSNDDRAIWKFDDFPARLDVKPLVLLDPENGIPMEKLAGKVQFYQDSKDAGKFKGFLRGSPAHFERSEDGELILQLLRDAREHPNTIPVDQRKLKRIPFYKAKSKVGNKEIETIVSVPPTEVETGETCETTPIIEAATVGTDHTQIQYLLLTLGAEMGLDVWVARNDRSKLWNGMMLGSLPHMAENLPTHFNEVTQKTIELIDVLWLKENSIVSAFEVECTTSIYSGLLRMSDLLALQPNLDIKLYLVAPNERRQKVEQEILRPTFQLRPKPLNKVCGYLALDKLAEKVEAIRSLELASSLNSDFLVDTAEYFEKQKL